MYITSRTGVTNYCPSPWGQICLTACFSQIKFYCNIATFSVFVLSVATFGQKGRKLGIFNRDQMTGKVKKNSYLFLLR